jgi:hypothetical protein
LVPRSYDRGVHLRPPSIDHGVISLIWAVVLGGFIWLFLAGIGVSGATSFIVGVVAAGAIFLYVRVFGEEEPRRQRLRPPDRST